MIKQITIDKPTKSNLFAPDDALITTSTTAVDFVTDDLEKLAVELISNNELRVKSGVFCIGGHYGCIQNGTYETCFVSPGNVGFNRKDLIVARYTRVGNLDYIGVQIYTGVPTKGVPVVPALTVSDLNTGGKIREIALHEVELVDMDIVNVNEAYNILIRQSEFFETRFGSIGGQYRTYLDTFGIVEETISVVRANTFIYNVEGVWKANSRMSGTIYVDAGYYPTDIVAFCSILGGSIVKAQIESITWNQSGSIITFIMQPYAFAQFLTELSVTYNFLFRYKKTKL